MTAITRPSPSACSVCHQQPGKYKCPRCTDITYCSVSCFRLHQQDERCDSKAAAAADPPDSVAISPSPLVTTPAPAPLPLDIASTSAPHLLDNGRTINPSAFQRLTASPSLLAALRHPELQSIIRNIDSAADRVERLDLYRRSNSDFEEFIRTLLQTLTSSSSSSSPSTADDVDLDALLATIAQSA